MAKQQSILDRPLRDFANKCFWCGAKVGFEPSKNFPCVCMECFFVLRKHRGEWYPLRDGKPIKTRFKLRPHHWVDLLFVCAFGVPFGVLIGLILKSYGVI